MGDYLSNVNSGAFYGIVALVLGFVTVMCFVFLIKSYRTGIKIGMDKKVLRKTITASATFTLLPSISILLGVIALSGSLGVPFSWLRLSVIGALQYELNVAEIGAQSYGLSGLKVSEMNMEAFVTIALVMTVGILGGVVCCVFFLKKYLAKVQKKPKKVELTAEEAEVAENKRKEEAEKEKKPGFGAYATTAMFVGLCAAYIGSYIGKACLKDGADVMPIIVAVIAAVFMGIFEFFIQKKKVVVLENFSLAVSMLLAMASAVLLQMVM